MSAGVCGKRVGYEEIFASASTSAKRSRLSSFGSPTRSSEFVSLPVSSISALLQMFPALDPELVENVLQSHNNKMEDAIHSLRALSVGDVAKNNNSPRVDSIAMRNCAAVSGQTVDICNPMSEQNVEDVKNQTSTSDHKDAMDGFKWVDLFVHEMMAATDLDDARGRAARILEAFERSISSHSRESKEQEHASLKVHLQSLLNDNQILKRAVSIQHERNLEQEEKTKEVQQLKHVLSQYQEQIRTLELSNYTLKLHLQRTQESNSIPGQFHPDIF